MSFQKLNEVIKGSIRRAGLRFRTVTGAAAGTFTVTDIKLATDTLVAVLHLQGTTTLVTGIANLSGEYEIIADGAIANTGGTSSADGNLIVAFWSSEEVASIGPSA